MMVLERGHLGNAKVCGVRKRYLFYLKKIDTSNKIDDTYILKEFQNTDQTNFKKAKIKQQNDKEWLVKTGKEQFLIKKEKMKFKVYKNLDDLTGSMITVPVSAQKRLRWVENITIDKRIDCLSTSRDVILYRMISYEPITYKLDLKNISSYWENLTDDMKDELLRTIVLSPSLKGVYVNLEIYYPDDKRYDEFIEYFRRIQPYIPAEIKETYEYTSFNFTLASEQLCEELYSLVNDRKSLKKLQKERGFVDFYWQLLKDISNDSRAHIKNIANTLIQLTDPEVDTDFEKSFNRMLSITKTIRLKIWANYSYAINIAFGHKGVILLPQLTILRAWDGILKYLKRLLIKYNELNTEELKEYRDIIYIQINEMAKMLKKSVEFTKEDLNKNETCQVINLLKDLYSEEKTLKQEYVSVNAQKVLRNISIIYYKLTSILRQILYNSQQNIFTMEEEDKKIIEEIINQRKKIFRVKIGKRLISLPKEIRKVHNWDENTRLEVYSPSGNTLLYYNKNAKPFKLSFNLEDIMIKNNKNNKEVYNRIIKDIIIVGSLIGPNVQITLKLPKDFKQRQIFHEICKEMLNLIEVKDWEDDFAKGEITYYFGLSNKTFQDILNDICKRFHNSITILEGFEKLSEIDEDHMHLLEDYAQETMKYFEKQFSIAINITYARGGIDLSYFFIIWRMTLISHNLHKLSKDLLNSKNKNKTSFIQIQEIFDDGIKLLKDTTNLINSSIEIGKNDALDILCRSMILNSQLSEFDIMLNNIEQKIFEDIWNITDSIVSILKFWIYMNPVDCLYLEETKVLE